jgi:DNA-directed RNA polymerase subunit RPC12/RpoP
VIRYRCTACGNLTRFDVTVSRRTRAFHHYTVGGELAVEEEHVLSEAVDEVACRWCGHGRAVEVVAPGEGESPAGGDQGERPGPTPAEEQVI